MIRRFITPTLQISTGLLLLTLSLILVGYSFGLLPNEEKTALETRARISESLAVQLASMASRNDEAAIKDTIASVVGRHDVLSVGIRKPDGSIVVASDDHARLWQEPADGKSTPTYVQVPLMNADVPQGKIEFVFQPLPYGTNPFGLPAGLLGFIGFIGVAGFGAYYAVLRRALRELDPSRAIPERVKAAFDALAEGVLIMDEREYILLANDAFVKKIHADTGRLYGTRTSKLPWMELSTVGAPAELPWQHALRSAAPVLGIPMVIRGPTGAVHQLMVNSTPIVDGKGVVRGAIATFDDVTELHQTNERLNSTIEQLHLSQAKISEQNKELLILASSDPLTGCLNRRTFFAKAEAALGEAREQGRPLSFLMLDVDHFKAINDRFGHVVGDKVLMGLVALLKTICGDAHLVGRYGGEEFCIATRDLGADEAKTLAEDIRLAVAGVTNWLPNGESSTLSIGIASLGESSSEIADLVKHADEALYAAKSTGRNRSIVWSNMPRGSAASTSRSSPATPNQRRIDMESLPPVESHSIAPSPAAMLSSMSSAKGEIDQGIDRK